MYAFLKVFHLFFGKGPKTTEDKLDLLNIIYFFKSETLVDYFMYM